MPLAKPIADKVRDKIAEVVVEAAIKSGLPQDEKTKECLTLLTEMIYASVVFMIDTAKSGGHVEKQVLIDFLVIKFSKQFAIFGNKTVDCVFALAGFAVDTAILAPTIDAAIGIGAAATASGAGAPIGLSVIASAMVASAYLTMQAMSANNKCQDAIQEAVKSSENTKAGNTQLRVNAVLLSSSSVGLFNFTAKQSQKDINYCSE